MEFITSANQRKITIHKRDKESGYTKLDVESLKEAQAALGPSAFKVYTYFAMNRTGFQHILSQVALCRDLDMSKNTYYAAFKELLEKGYLVLKPGFQCLFDFYESPSMGKNASGNVTEKWDTTVPNTGMGDTQNCDREVQKMVENTLNTKNTSSGKASSLSRDDKEEYSGNDVRHPYRKMKNSIFYDI